MGRVVLAWRYLAFHWRLSLLLVASFVMTAYVPLAIGWLTGRFQEELSLRSDSTPLVIGSRGSRYDLVLSALYFDGEPPAGFTAGARSRVEESGLAIAVPLFVRHRAKGAPIVGTSLDYFSFRGLTIARGEALGRLGDCVVGANVARKWSLSPGDSLLSDPDNVFDIAGSYPLKMHVVGILDRAFSPDDDAVFVDVKTAWIIEGIGHGHDDANSADEAQVLDREKGEVSLNASVVQYTEITDSNIDSFHFHGNPDEFPLSAVICIPPDEKAGSLLAGRFVDPKSTEQIVRPTDVVRELMGTVLKMKRFFDLQSVVMAVGTLLLVVIVLTLSARLRQGEMQTLAKIGCARGTVWTLFVVEWTILLLASATILAGMLWATTSYAPLLLRQLLF